MPSSQSDDVDSRTLQEEKPLRISAPAYRHAAPSGPWPWMDIDSAREHDDPSAPIRDPNACSHKRDVCNQCWTGYPQSLFPNWRPAQVKRCAMKDKVAGSHTCVIHQIDVKNDAKFEEGVPDVVEPGKEDDFWQVMQEERPPELRVRALFVENLSRPVLEMLGTKYNIEPFFFSSSLNWIPSRFQENPKHGEGDHITVTLTFLRPMKVPRLPEIVIEDTESFSSMKAEQVIDTQAPLLLRSADDDRKEDRILLLDLLAIHMVRKPGSSTIITYHPPLDRQDPPQPNKSAQHLHNRIALAGQSVYWGHIFQRSDDPTFVFLAILWHALYAWDEALEALWETIGHLELSVIVTNNMDFTQELHKIRAHLLYYLSLMDDFKKTVEFVRDTTNPALESPVYDAERLEDSKELLAKECKNLLTEVDRLIMSGETQDKRLANVMHLVFSKVNIEDSKRMHQLTQATVRDSEAMKQIAYLTMFFLPASFCTGVFGMNIEEINPGTFGTLAKYFATAIPLTAITVWIVIALQTKWRMHMPNISVLGGLWKALSWPLTLLISLFKKENSRPNNTLQRVPTRFTVIEMQRADTTVTRDSHFGLEEGRTGNSSRV